MDLYFFDLDKTLYAYDFRRRLPALAALADVSQYALAKRWWAGGYERQAEAGAWPTPDVYLDRFAEVTRSRRLSLQEWAQARSAAMTAMPATIAALRHAATLGTVSLLSNNPAATGAALPLIAPDVADIIGPNALFSYQLGTRKPDPELYRRALARYGAETAFLLDDALPNVLGAREAGLTAVHLEWVDGVARTDGVVAAIDAYAGRHV